MDGKVLFAVVLSFLLVNDASCYSSGAPQNACNSMIPGHSPSRPGFAGELSDIPYILTTSVTSLMKGTTLTVKIEKANSSVPNFKGFIVQARYALNEAKLGEFVAPESESKLLRCDKDGDTLTHTSNTPKASMTATWKATETEFPEEKNVIFYYSIVQSHQTYWSKKMAASGQVTVRITGSESSTPVNSEASTTTTPPVTTTTTTTTTTTAAPELEGRSDTEPEPEPETETEPAGEPESQSSVSESESEPLTESEPEAEAYTGCSGTTGCVGLPVGCLSTADCKALYSYQYDEANERFLMSLWGEAADSRYIAVAFSEDSDMNDDLAISCRNLNGVPTIKFSWNTGKTSRDDITGVSVLSSPAPETMLENGKLKCKFYVNKDLLVNLPNDGGQENFMLADKEYYILLAYGDTNNDGVLTYHDDRSTTTDALDLKKLETEVAEPESEPQTGYPGCFQEFGCFGLPSDCVKTATCQVLFSYKYDDSKKTFELTLEGESKDPGYLAMAFSEDDDMNEDLVISCRNMNSEQSVKFSWNKDKGNVDGVTGVEVLSVPAPVMTVGDGKMKCTFSVAQDLEANLPNDGGKKSFLLGDKAYFILLAHGDLDSNGALQYHSKRIASDEAVDMKKYSAVKTDSGPEVLIQVHGCLMSIAWVGLASSGMILARYFKETWRDTKPCGKDLWFRGHQFFMGGCITLALIGLFFIIGEEGFEPFAESAIKANPHAAIGIVALILGIVQPLMALVRPAPDASSRPIFNWAHWFVGNGAWLLAITAIFLSAELPNSGLTIRATTLMIVFVVGHVVVHLMLTLQRCLSQNGTQKVYSGGSQEELIVEEDMSGSGIRKVIYIIYFVFVWAVVIGMIALIAEAIDENVFDRVKEHLGHGDHDHGEAEAEGEAEPEAES